MGFWGTGPNTEAGRADWRLPDFSGAETKAWADTVAWLFTEDERRLLSGLFGEAGL